ncbi:hypothetical protein Hypma_006539 [Hypsizygus marmoreus]|uniref:Uncharacterized protein n=1 Tax=Hypsizygus marmoreus TaxID=39966 RepID=A0A369K4J9_HYPMA|nr:hypothetical protein Hypma_006539 [Hypsizygus marmoreus]
MLAKDIVSSTLIKLRGLGSRYPDPTSMHGTTGAIRAFSEASGEDIFTIWAKTDRKDHGSRRDQMGE